MSEEKKLKPVQLGLFYLLWLTSAVLIVLDVLFLRAGITALAASLLDRVSWEYQVEHLWYARFSLTAIDAWFLALAGLAAFLCIIGLDYLYRAAILKEKITKTFGTVTAIQVGVLVLSLIMSAIGSALV
ncbi:MAG: hypothetical protein JW934_17010 [Anaerolineae bacterium]|nr:hypothetical protein [Anaerolineae bacterium]